MVEADVTIIVRQRHADASAVRSELCEARSGSACATLLAPTVPSFALLPPAAVPGGGVSSSRASQWTKIKQYPGTYVRTDKVPV